METSSHSHSSKNLFLWTGLLLSRFASSLPLTTSPSQDVFDRSDNIALYWGQNSAGASSPPLAQRRLVEYCRDTTANIIPLAFLTQIRTASGGEPVLNFANQESSCSVFPGTNLLDCPEIGADIKTCQSVYGKKILLSIGGATYSDGGFATPAQAVAAADLLVRTFGPPATANNAARQVLDMPAVNVTNWDASAHGGLQKSDIVNATNLAFPHQNGTNSTLQRNWQPPTAATLETRATTTHRPFGDAILDGFNLDFESTVAFAVPFARALRARLDANQQKRTYLTLAPTCPDSNIADDILLNSIGIHFDAVFVQFYNSPCGLQSFQPGAARQLDFNFKAWNTWAAPRRTKVFLGVPAAAGAANDGYLSPRELRTVIKYSQHFEHFGGVAAWDASQALANSGFLKSVRNALGR